MKHLKYYSIFTYRFVFFEGKIEKTFDSLFVTLFFFIILLYKIFFFYADK